MTILKLSECAICHSKKIADYGHEFDFDKSSLHIYLCLDCFYCTIILKPANSCHHVYRRSLGQVVEALLKKIGRHPESFQPLLKFVLEKFEPACPIIDEDVLGNIFPADEILVHPGFVYCPHCQAKMKKTRTENGSQGQMCGDPCERIDYFDCPGCGQHFKASYWGNEIERFLERL